MRAPRAAGQPPAGAAAGARTSSAACSSAALAPAVLPAPWLDSSPSSLASRMGELRRCSGRRAATALKRSSSSGRRSACATPGRTDGCGGGGLRMRTGVKIASLSARSALASASRMPLLSAPMYMSARICARARGPDSPQLAACVRRCLQATMGLRRPSSF